MTAPDNPALPPLAAGEYLGTRPERESKVFYFRQRTDQWFDADREPMSDPRVFGWTLTPVASIETWREELGRKDTALEAAHVAKKQLEHAHKQTLADIAIFRSLLKEIRALRPDAAVCNTFARIDAALTATPRSAP